MVYLQSLNTEIFTRFFFPEIALLSVFDKTGLSALAHGLADAGFLLVASGGTYKYLRQESIPVRETAEITGAKEMLDGRVKTLHPVVRRGGCFLECFWTSYCNFCLLQTSKFQVKTF